MCAFACAFYDPSAQPSPSTKIPHHSAATVQRAFLILISSFASPIHQRKTSGMLLLLHDLQAELMGFKSISLRETSSANIQLPLFSYLMADSGILAKDQYGRLLISLNRPATQASRRLSRSSSRQDTLPQLRRDLLLCELQIGACNSAVFAMVSTTAYTVSSILKEK